MYSTGLNIRLHRYNDTLGVVLLCFLYPVHFVCPILNLESEVVGDSGGGSSGICTDMSVRTYLRLELICRAGLRRRCIPLRSVVNFWFGLGLGGLC